MDKDIMPVLMIILLCSVITITYMAGVYDYGTEYDICEEGLSFVKLEVTPQFESPAQAEFYIEQYKQVAEGCINGRSS